MMRNPLTFRPLLSCVILPVSEFKLCFCFTVFTFLLVQKDSTRILFTKQSHDTVTVISYNNPSLN